MSYLTWGIMTTTWKTLKNDRADATTVLKTFGVVAPAVPVRQIIEELGIKLHEVLDPGWAGAVRLLDDDTAHIWVNAADHEVRQNFTIAHELGHLLLHPEGELREEKSFRDNPKFSGGYKEVEANRFAANLLVPAWMLENEAPVRHYDISMLADVFDVSYSMMQIRLTQLMIGHI